MLLNFKTPINRKIFYILSFIGTILIHSKFVFAGQLVFGKQDFLVPIKSVTETKQEVRIRPPKLQLRVIVLTEESFNTLHQENIPEGILEDLKPLQGIGYAIEKDFLNNVKKLIGEEKTGRYKDLILNHAIKPLEPESPDSQVYYQDVKIVRTLAYHYQVHAFILPYWMSYKGYVIKEGNNQYYEIGKYIDKDLQNIFKLNTSRPRVPWTPEKGFAYFFGYITYSIIGLGIFVSLIKRFRKKKKAMTVITRWSTVSQVDDEKLGDCPECATRIPLNSISCPNCGYPHPF